MTLDWSFSTDNRMRRCERQVFFSNVAACHNARDPLRKESFLLGQVKSLEAWRGLVVHQAIESLVLPYWRDHRNVPWEEIVTAARALVWRQFEFSSRGQYREEGMSKRKAQGDYCALFAHEFGFVLTGPELESVLDGVERAIRNLSSLEEFSRRLEGSSFYRSEVALTAEYNGVRIRGQADLIFSHRYGQYGVVDWKDYEAAGSDARRQMALYAWLMCQSPTWRVSKPESIELWEVKLGQPPAAVIHAVDQQAFDELEDFMYRSTERLKALCGDGIYRASDLEDFAHTENSNSCRFCPYRNVCREPEKWIHISLTSMKSKKQAA